MKLLHLIPYIDIDSLMLRSPIGPGYLILLTFGHLRADSILQSLCVNALQRVFWRRKPNLGLLHHSDRGSQYASQEYREHIDIMKLQQSMSRKGNCCDNTPTDRFFRSLKHVQITKDKTKESCFSYHYKSLG